MQGRTRAGWPIAAGALSPRTHLAFLGDLWVPITW